MRDLKALRTSVLIRQCNRSPHHGPPPLLQEAVCPDKKEEFAPWLGEIKHPLPRGRKREGNSDAQSAVRSSCHRRDLLRTALAVSVFWLADRPTRRAFSAPFSGANGLQLRLSSPLTATGSRRIFTGLPSESGPTAACIAWSSGEMHGKCLVGQAFQPARFCL